MVGKRARRRLCCRPRPREFGFGCTRIFWKQVLLAEQALRGLRPAHDLAQEMGEELGSGEVLLGSLS